MMPKEHTRQEISPGRPHPPELVTHVPLRFPATRALLAPVGGRPVAVAPPRMPERPECVGWVVVADRARTRAREEADLICLTAVLATTYVRTYSYSLGAAPAVV